MKIDLQTEKALVERAKESLQAFDALYEYYLPRIYGFIYNRTRSREVAEDVTSQTFIKAMTKIKSFRYQGYTFGAWLYRIAHNALVDFFRKHPEVKLFDINRIKSEEEPNQKTYEEERQQIILEALKRLPKQYQQILSLKYFEELTNEEIADVLGCKKTTLAVKLHRSLKSLEKVMKRDGFDKLLNITD